MRALGVEDELLETGLGELAAVVDGCAHGAGEKVSVEANLRIARGLDYYTGTVVEIFMSGYEHLKSVGGGGRYDALADDGKNVYPGVGVSFGVSRTLVPLIADGVLTASRSVPSVVLVALTDEESRQTSDAVATALRARGIPCEVAASPRSSASRSARPSAGGSRSSGSQRRTGTRSRTSAPATRSRPTPRPGRHPTRTCDRTSY